MMNSETSTPTTLVDRLNNVISHDRAALEACEAAAVRMTAIKPRYRLRELANEHLRRIDKLSGHVSKLGGLPTRDKYPLARERDEMKELDGDRSLLQAVLENEEQVTEAYEGILEGKAPLPEVDSLLQRQIRRQHRYRNWLRRRVDQAD
jgi:hypothetical protein